MLHKNLLKGVLDSPAMLVLTLLGTVFATFSASFYDLSPAIRIAVVLFVVFLAYRGGAAYFWSRNFRKLEAPNLALSPFAHQPDWRPWPRPKAKDLSDFIEKAPGKHILLIAPSGAGKSVITNKLLLTQRPDLLAKVFEEYQDFLTVLGVALSEVFANNEIFHQFCALETKLKLSPQEDIDDDLNLIGQLLSDKNTKHEALLVFDQAERLAALIQKRREGDSGDKYAKTIQYIISKLKDNRKVRTIFSIRSTNLFEVFIYIFNADDRDSRFGEESAPFFLWGLNEIDDRDFHLDLYKEITALRGSTDDLNKILEVARFKDQKNADSFGLRLAVYLFSIINERDRGRLFERMQEASETGDLINVMFDAAYEHHALTSSGPVDRALFDIVVFALAAETRASGLACSLPRVARLAHYPIEDVESVVDNLCSIGLVKSALVDNVCCYRFAHDSIADYVFQDERLNVHSRAIDGIRSLTEAAIASSDLVEVRSFPRAIERNGYGWRSISYLAVVFFVLFGLVRIVFPETLYHIYTSVFTSQLGGPGYYGMFSMPAYYVNPIMYVPNFAVHILWVSYVDRMNRSFIQYVGSNPAKLLANALAPMGTILGICVAFSPQLFVVPIVSVGFLFGVVLYAISLQRNMVGEIKEITSGWGFRSSINVVVALLLAIFAIPLYSGAIDVSQLIPFAGLKSEEIHLGLIVLESLVLYWFWVHIRDEQNRPKAWAANLGLFDKGRMGGAGHHE